MSPRARVARLDPRKAAAHVMPATVYQSMTERELLLFMLIARGPDYDLSSFMVVVTLRTPTYVRPTARATRLTRPRPPCG